MHRSLPALLTSMFLAAGCGGEGFYEGFDPGTLETDPSDTEAVATTELALTPSQQVEVEKVRYCRNATFCNGRLSRDDYQPWETHGVARDKQRNTYLATVSDPPREAVEYVAFYSAGQQFTELGSGNSSGVTGQPEGWQKDWPSTQRVAQRQLGWSLATQTLWEEFPSNKTFASLAFDARFNYNFSPDQKNRIVSAYYDWLLSQFEPNRVRMIYLAGHSRGGCLVMRLAQMFNERHPQLPVVVHSFDGVCHPNQGELGTTTSARVDNPVQDQLVADWFGWSTDIAAQYTHPGSLSILHFAGGHPALGEASQIATYARTFSHVGATEADTSIGQWYRQLWVDAKHVQVDNGPQREIALEHLRESKERLLCPGTQRWNGSECAAAPVMERWATRQGGYWDAQRWFAGDFDEDGKADLAKVFDDGGAGTIDVHLSTGSSFVMQRWATKQGGYWDAQKWMAGDFDGDGKTDLAKVFDDGGAGTIDVHLSTGSAFVMQRWATKQGGYWDAQKWLTGNFTGDWTRRDEVAKVFDDQGAGTIDVHPSTGSSFFMQRWATRQGGYWHDQKWMRGDFDGDGRTDLAKAFSEHGFGSIDVHWSTGGGFTMSRWVTQQGGYWDAQRWFTGNFDGDAQGRDDFAKVFWDEGAATIDVHRL